MNTKYLILLLLIINKIIQVYTLNECYSEVTLENRWIGGGDICQQGLPNFKEIMYYREVDRNIYLNDMYNRQLILTLNQSNQIIEEHKNRTCNHLKKVIFQNICSKDFKYFCDDLIDDKCNFQYKDIRCKYPGSVYFFADTAVNSWNKDIILFNNTLINQVKSGIPMDALKLYYYKNKLPEQSCLNFHNSQDCLRKNVCLYGQPKSPNPSPSSDIDSTTSILIIIIISIIFFAMSIFGFIAIIIHSRRRFSYINL